MSPVTLEWRDECAILTLNRPDVLNAINSTMLDELEATLDTLEHGTAKVLILTGAGRAFCSGSDMKDGEEHGADRHAWADARIRRMHALLLRLVEFPVPSIAALNGLAYGGGLELALACTLRTAAHSARFAMPEIRLGLMPSYGGTVLLPRIVGAGRALEFMLTGESIEAAEAQRIGLVTSAGDDALAEALALADRLPFSTGISQRMIRRCVASGITGDLAAALEEERRVALEVAQSSEIRDVAARFAARQREQQ